MLLHAYLDNFMIACNFLMNCRSQLASKPLFRTVGYDPILLSNEYSENLILVNLSSNSFQGQKGTEYFQSAEKRPYLADYKPFYTVFGAKNFAIQLSRAIMLSFTPGIIAYNRHLDAELRREQAIDDVTDRFQRVRHLQLLLN